MHFLLPPLSAGTFRHPAPRIFHSGWIHRALTQALYLNNCYSVFKLFTPYTFVLGPGSAALGVRLGGRSRNRPGILALEIEPVKREGQIFFTTLQAIIFIGNCEWMLQQMR